MPKQEQKSSIADYYEDKEKSDSKNISMQKNPMHSKESKPSQQPTINNSQFLNDDEDAKNRKNNTNKLATLIISYGPKSNPLSRKKLSKPKENAQANINIEPSIQTPPTSQSKLDKQTTSLVKSIIAESGEKIAEAEKTKANLQVAQEKFKEPTIQKYVQSDKISTAEKDKVSKESKRSNIDFSKRDFEAELKKARELEEKTREKFEKSRETLEELKKKEKEKNFTKEEKDSLNKLKGLEKTYEIRQAITKSKEKLLNKSKGIDVDKMREGLIDRSDNVNSNPIVIKGQAQENYRGR